jgi:hypothetical protein
MITPTTLHEAVDDVLDRLGDKANGIWTRAEIELFYKDGYDQFCRRTRCIFDKWAIENLPVTGNWQTDLEKYLMEQKAGRTLTDQPMGYTAEHEKNLGVGGRYGGHKGVAPTPGTAVADKEYYAADSTGSIDDGLPTTVPGGDLPNSIVDLVGVYYDRRRLVGTTTDRLRELDPNYETREGDPQYYAWDKDGLYYLRVVPRAGGDADYVTVNGQRGRMTFSCDEAEATVTGTSTLPTANKNVVVNGTTYTFKATVASAGHIKIAATTALTLKNLEYAINNSGGTSGAGNDYMPAVADTAHATVEASASGLVLTLTQRDDLDSPLSRGVAGESYTLTSTETTFTLSGATFVAAAVDTNVCTEIGGRATGGFGILRHEEGAFPAGGTWGSPTRMHPHAVNIDVELFRLGRDLDSHPIELPDAYKKYVLYFAMSKALERPGHGQDLEMSKHFHDRFLMGIDRMTRKQESMSEEYVGTLGGGGASQADFALGDPQTPYYDWDMEAPT